jgi:hypothetical protein
MSKRLSPEELERRVEFTARVRPEQMRAIGAMAKKEMRSHNNMVEALLRRVLEEIAGEPAAWSGGTGA